MGGYVNKTFSNLLSSTPKIPSKLSTNLTYPQALPHPYFSPFLKFWKNKSIFEISTLWYTPKFSSMQSGFPISNALPPTLNLGMLLQLIWLQTSLILVSLMSYRSVFFLIQMCFKVVKHLSLTFAQLPSLTQQNLFPELRDVNFY